MKTKKVISTILALIILLCTITCFPSVASAKTYFVKATRITSLTQTDITTFKINWAKVSGVKGYVLYYSTNGSNYKKLTTTKSRVYYHKNLKNGVKYYYKIKTYTKVKGKTKYSKFSSIRAKICTNNLVCLYNPYRTRNYELYTGTNRLSLSGKTYYNGFLLSTSSWSSGSQAYADYNLSGKYSYIKFTFGYSDNSYNGAEDTLYIMSDDEEIASYKLKAGDLAKTVKVNIKKANKLEFLVEPKNCNWDKSNLIGFVNISLYK
ncbi:MAG: NPCBM/NEW2 domain-containing protein [Ruminococcus sp.]